MTTQQCTAKYNDGAETTVTGTAAWESSDEEVATVSAGGLITAVAVGECVVTATYEGVSDTCDVTVTEA